MKKKVGFGFMETNALSFHLTIRLNAAVVFFAMNSTIVRVATRALFSEHLHTFNHKSNKILFSGTKPVLLTRNSHSDDPIIGQIIPSLVCWEVIFVFWFSVLNVLHYKL